MTQKLFYAFMRVENSAAPVHSCLLLLLLFTPCTTRFYYVTILPRTFCQPTIAITKNLWCGHGKVRYHMSLQCHMRPKSQILDKWRRKTRERISDYFLSVPWFEIYPHTLLISHTGFSPSPKRERHVR